MTKFSEKLINEPLIKFVFGEEKKIGAPHDVYEKLGGHPTASQISKQHHKLDRQVGQIRYTCINF